MRHVRQERGFIAPRGRLLQEVARQQVGAVGLEHEPAGRYAADEGLQARAAPLVADPARDADVQPELEIGFEFVPGSGEAMRNATLELPDLLAQDGKEIVVGVALVQKYRFSEVGGEFELAGEGAALHGPRAEVAVVVETALADRDHRIQRAELPQRELGFGVEVGRMMRVDPRGGAEPDRVGGGERDGFATARDARPGHHHLYHAGAQRAPADRLPVRIEARMGEVDADVDQFHLFDVRRGETWRAMIRRLPLLALFGLLGPLACGAAEGDLAPDSRWLDVESQIQYYYYTEDERELASLAAALAAAPARAPSGDDPRRPAYFAALAQYRLAEIVHEHDQRQAAERAQRCVREVEAVAAAHDDPESLALEASCLALARRPRSPRWPFLGETPEQAITRARRLAPRNPRVVLQAGVIEYEQADSGAERERALDRFEEATRLFELERRGMTVTPGWGAAEAYLYVGVLDLERGDAVAARGALERALLIAPDFRRARELLGRIVGG